MKPLAPLALLLAALSVLALFRSYPEDRPRYRSPEITAQERREVRQAIRRHGDYRITWEAGRMTMQTPGGRVRL